MGGGSTQTLYGGRKSERGQGVGFVPDAGVVLVSVLEEICLVDVYVYEAFNFFVDFVEHPQADLSSSMFQTCPF